MKLCIYPSQIQILHYTFKPTEEQISKAQIIIDAVEKADIENGGVIFINGKMIDIAVITKAKKIISLLENT